jgi:acyl carrier protein/serine acetyltransferase
MTESTGPVACSRGGALGYRPLEGVQIRIIREDGTIAAANEPGEIQVKGPTVFSGYCGVSEETNESAFLDGWFKSGDAGKFDDHGNLFITGRLKDMIIVAGENVFAAEVEAVISKIEAIKLVAVIGKPDKMLGEVVEAAVILQDGQNASEASIIEFCRQKIADFKVPKKIHLVKEMPMTASGKVQKAELKALLYTDEKKTPETTEKPQMETGSIEESLQRVIRDNFGLDLQVTDSLFESGLSSLQAIELLSLAEDMLGCELPGSLLFECSSIEDIVEFLREEGLVKGFDESMGSRVMSGISRALTRQFTRVTSGIMRLRHLHNRGGVDYVTLNQDTYTEQVEGRERLKAWNQNHPLVLLMQAFLLLITRPVVVTVGFAPLILLFTFLDERWPLSYQFLVASPVIIVSSFMMVITLAALKWILLGRIRPGVHPLWGWYYCRWLAIHNTSRWVFRFLGIYRSTPFYAMFFRLMGTKIGAHAVIDTCWITDNDLVTIGKRSYIARDVNIQPSYVSDGFLTLKEIYIGDEVAIRHGACILGGANIFDRAIVGYLQTVHTAIIPKGEDTELPVPAEVKSTSSYHNSLAYFLLQCSGLVYIGYIFSVCVILAGEVMYRVFEASRINEGLPFATSITVLVDSAYFWPMFYMGLCIPLALWFILPWSYFICIFLTKWIFIGQLPAMVMLTEKPLVMDMWKRWLLIRLTDWWWFQVLLATTTMSELSCTLYRLLGSKVGTRVYFNAPYIGADFDLLEVDDDCMIAWDVSLLCNCATGVSRPVMFERGACVANNLVLPDGVKVQANSLVGDLVSAPSGHKFTPGTVWTGKGRPICVGKTSVPPPATNMIRYYFFETLLCTMQVLLPLILNMPGVVAILFIKKGISTAITNSNQVSDTARVLIMFLPLFPVIVYILMICKLLVMIAAKWIVLGRFKPGPTPKFTTWKYVSWVALDSIIFEMEMAWLNDIRGTAFACVRCS